MLVTNIPDDYRSDSSAKSFPAKLSIKSLIEEIQEGAIETNNPIICVIKDYDWIVDQRGLIYKVFLQHLYSQTIATESTRDVFLAYHTAKAFYEQLSILFRANIDPFITLDEIKEISQTSIKTAYLCLGKEKEEMRIFQKLVSSLKELQGNQIEEKKQAEAILNEKIKQVSNEEILNDEAVRPTQLKHQTYGEILKANENDFERMRAIHIGYILFFNEMIAKSDSISVLKTEFEAYLAKEGNHFKHLNILSSKVRQLTKITETISNETLTWCLMMRNDFPNAKKMEIYEYSSQSHQEIENVIKSIPEETKIPISLHCSPVNLSDDDPMLAHAAEQMRPPKIK